MMATFQAAIPVLMAHEAGWCDVPGDLGGETNFGWSTLTIKRLGLTAEDLGIKGPMFSPGYLKGMPRERALELYERFFWLPAYGQISDQISATKVFDFAVNAGANNSARVAQRAAGVSVDGVLGPVSVAAINALGTRFRDLMGESMVNYYEAIIKARPVNAKFRTGWLKRAAWGT
jgi:lysozyme family protein